MVPNIYIPGRLNKEEATRLRTEVQVYAAWVAKQVQDSCAKVVEDQEGWEIIYNEEEDRPTQVCHVDLFRTVRNIARAIRDLTFHT